jgi:hypothetical protein
MKLAHVPKYVAADGKLYLLEVVLADRNLVNLIYVNWIKLNVKIYNLSENLKQDHMGDLGIDGGVTLE